MVDRSRLLKYAAEMAALEQQGQIERASEITIVDLAPDARLSEEKLTLEELHERAAKTAADGSPCHGCPANAREKRHRCPLPFGCHGWIDYPIDASVELLLHVTLRFVTQRSLGLPEGRLVRFIVDNGIDGEVARSLRHGLREGQPAFTQRPAALSWSFDDATGQVSTIDTDQILEAVFLGGGIDAEVAGYLYGPFFEVLDTVADIVSKERSVKHAEHVSWSGCAQLRAFGTAVVLARDLGVSLLVEH